MHGLVTHHLISTPHAVLFSFQFQEQQCLITAATRSLWQPLSFSSKLSFGAACMRVLVGLPMSFCSSLKHKHFNIVCNRYVNSYRATVRVANAASYLATQAESVLKNVGDLCLCTRQSFMLKGASPCLSFSQVVAEFPYEPPADHAPSLRTHAHQVNQRLVESLQVV